MTSDQYAFKDCLVNLPNGATKQLQAGIYPVVINGTGLVEIDIIKTTTVTHQEFMRLQAEGFARKVP